MQCDICQRHANNKVAFICDTCARAALYLPRLALVEAFVKNDGLGQEVESQIASSKSSKTSFFDQKSQIGNLSWTLQRAQTEQQSSDHNTQQAQTHIQALRDEVQHMKLDIAKRKAKLARRRKDIATAKTELSVSRQTRPSSLQKDLDSIRQQWQDIHQQTVHERLDHCTKTADLFSLRQDKRRKGPAGKDLYSIGFSPIPEPREWNNASPAHITAVFLHLANLTHLISYYLALRLPAQIMLPTSTYPFPTILSPNVSYTGIPPSLPGTDPSQSTHVNSTASRQPDQRTPPRARPLFLKKKLSALYKDEARAYAYLVEGMTLLAWDIAWLCKTQGMDIGRGSWEEVGAMGRNLWTFLLSPDSAVMSITSSKHDTAPAKDNKAAIVRKGGLNAGFAPTPGLFSHDSAYGFLAAFPASEYMHDWRLLNPIKVMDRMKAMLLAERTGAEWEVVEDGEWQEEVPEEKNQSQPESRLGIAGNTQQQTLGNPRVDDTGVLIKPVEKEDVQRRRGGKDKAGGWIKDGSG